MREEREGGEPKKFQKFKTKTQTHERKNKNGRAKKITKNTKKITKKITKKYKKNKNLQKIQNQNTFKIKIFYKQYKKQNIFIKSVFQCKTEKYDRKKTNLREKMMLQFSARTNFRTFLYSGKKKKKSLKRVKKTKKNKNQNM